jgi:esterase/lipase superfamily enzyme
MIMSYNLGEIRKLVIAALTEDDFLDLCEDHFTSVYQNFTDGQRHRARVRVLVSYAEKQRETPKLLEAIKTINPRVFAEFESLLVSSIAKADPLPKARADAGERQPLLEEPCDILVLAANPRGTDQLQLEWEAKLIREEIQKGRQPYTVKVEHTVQVEALSRYLLSYDPIIVHFSGHGNPTGEIILENDGGPYPVSAEAFAELLKTVGGRTECVVLNACFSLERADALVEQVSCVIGMTKDFDDQSALRFAQGFYRGLAFGRGYYSAFELGRAEIKLMKLPDEQVPQFITNDMTFMSRRVTRGNHATPTEERGKATLYPLWFGTNRRLVDPHDLTKGFSSERDSQLHYGTCHVAVPKSHEIGSIGSPWWKRLLKWSDDHLRLKQDTLHMLSKANFWANVKQSLQEHEPNERTALVFIHGFNVSFEASALRAAQIGFDLCVPGLTAFYSWPSKGKLTGYTADEATIEASEQYITEFLLQFIQHSGAEQIHLIAHSMGNRGLMRSMQRVLAQVREESGIPFGQIFLAAPDVEPDLFRELALAYKKLAHRITLYVSSKDKALATSGIIHDYPRVGFSPPITIIPGIDTVEVSNIDLTILGHGYYADARPLLVDMHSLLRHNESPDKRFGMREAATINNEKFWIIGS